MTPNTIFNLTLAGIPMLFLVFGLVEFLKKFNVRGTWLTAASMAIGIIVGVAYQLAAMYPDASTWISVAVFSLAVGLAASGLYDFANARFPKSGK